MARPDKYPEWASQDVVDPTSGVNNVVEPSEDKKDLGHGPLGEFPPRQYQNWFMRLVYRWIVWIDSELHVSGTYEAKVSSTDFDAEYKFNIVWYKNGDIVTILFPFLSRDSDNTQLRISPSSPSTWPAELVPAESHFVPFFVRDNTTDLRVGQINIQTTDSSVWILGKPADDGDLGAGGFTSSNNKGWPAQSITYSTKAF